MTPLADAHAPQDPARLARARAHRDHRCDHPDRDGWRDRGLRAVQERIRPQLPAAVHARGGREARQPRRAGRDRRLAAVRLRPVADPLPADEAGQAAVSTPRSGAFRPASCSSSRRSSPRGPSTSRTRTRSSTRSAPTRARSSGRRTSAASAPRHPPIRTASSTRSRCRRPPASTRARRSPCAPRTASCSGASSCPAAARPRRS